MVVYSFFPSPFDAIFLSWILDFLRHCIVQFLQVETHAQDQWSRSFSDEVEPSVETSAELLTVEGLTVTDFDTRGLITVAELPDARTPLFYLKVARERSTPSSPGWRFSTSAKLLACRARAARKRARLGRSPCRERREKAVLLQ